jgi:hypothetical protein
MRSSIKRRLLSDSQKGVRVYALFLLLLFVTGCASATPIPTLPPTPTLVRATERPTATPSTPTPTIPPRTDPFDLLATPFEFAATEATARIVDTLVQQAENDLLATLNVTRSEIRLVEIQEAVWRSFDFGCGEERPLDADELAIPGYRLLFEVAGENYAYHTALDGPVRRCNRSDVVVGEAQVLLEADPVAAELAALARRRVADTTGVGSDAVVVESIRAYRWTDTSLGCPLPDTTYEQVSIDGYRIVVRANDDEFLFHSTFEQLVRCEPENERLPDP